LNYKALKLLEVKSHVREQDLVFDSVFQSTLVLKTVTFEDKISHLVKKYQRFLNCYLNNLLTKILTTYQLTSLIKDFDQLLQTRPKRVFSILRKLNF